MGIVLAARVLERALRRLRRPKALRISVEDHVTTHERVGVRVVRAAVMGIAELWSRIAVTPERHLPHYSSGRESLPDALGSAVLAALIVWLGWRARRRPRRRIRPA